MEGYTTKIHGVLGVIIGDTSEKKNKKNPGFFSERFGDMCGSHNEELLEKSLGKFLNKFKNSFPAKSIFG